MNTNKLSITKLTLIALLFLSFCGCAFSKKINENRMPQQVGDIGSMFVKNVDVLSKATLLHCTFPNYHVDFKPREKFFLDSTSQTYELSITQKLKNYQIEKAMALLQQDPKDARYFILVPSTKKSYATNSFIQISKEQVVESNEKNLVLGASLYDSNLNVKDPIYLGTCKFEK